MRLLPQLTFLILFASSMAVPALLAQESSEQAVRQLEQEVRELRQEVREIHRKVEDAAAPGLALMLFGAFCALWAQNTGRNPWLWFFLGLFFSVVAVLVLLYKNSADKESDIFR